MLQDFRMGTSTLQVATVLLEEERWRNAEIAALEWKLQETRRRHVEELANIAAVDRSGILGTVSATTQLSGTWPIFPPAKVAAGSPFGAVRARAAQATPRELSTGPTLATRRRHVQGRRVQLWVEDRLASETARVHVMDEDGSWRTHSDVPDHSLSRMFEGFRQSRGRTLTIDDHVDIDDFLHALLDGVDLIEASSGDKGPELSLPSRFDNLRSAQATPKWTGGGAGSIGKLEQDQKADAAGSTSSNPQDQPRDCAGPSSLSPAGPQSLPSAGPLSPGNSPSEEVAGCCADSYSVNSTMDAPGRGEPAAIDPWHVGQSSRGRVCIGQVAPVARSSHHRILARPLSAPNRAKRPQTAYRLYRDRDRTVRAASPGPWESSRVSSSGRVRPTSAKALKHRRMEDDGNDSIIYEDIEGENEEFELCENYLAMTEAVRRSSTGGCGSRSGSVSSRSLSRRPSAHTCGRITSRPSSAASDCGTLVLDESMKIFFDEEMPEIPAATAADEDCTPDEWRHGAGVPSEPEAERPHDGARPPPAVATAAAAVEVGAEAEAEAEAQAEAKAYVEAETKGTARDRVDEDDERAHERPPEVVSSSVVVHREPIWVRGTRVAAGNKGTQGTTTTVRLIPRAPPQRNQLQRPNSARRSQLKTQVLMHACTDEASHEAGDAEQLFTGTSPAMVMAVPQVSEEREETLCVDVMAVEASNQEEKTSGPEPEEELAEGGFVCPTTSLHLGWGPRTSSPPPRMTPRSGLS